MLIASTSAAESSGTPGQQAGSLGGFTFAAALRPEQPALRARVERNRAPSTSTAPASSYRVLGTQKGYPVLVGFDQMKTAIAGI